MNVVKDLYGYWIISDIIKGYRVEKKYLYYTKKESIKMFKEEFF